MIDSTVVEHSTQTPKIEGSKPAAATEGQKAALFSIYSKTSFLVQIKFITEDLQQTQTQTLIIN